jgi:excisionase family DNA binding protein
MQVIIFEDRAFWALLEEVINHFKEQQLLKAEKWLTTQEAMKLLNVKSKTTLQKLRDEGKIRFSQPEKKIILYDRSSLEDYLDKNAKEPF